MRCGNLSTVLPITPKNFLLCWQQRGKMFHVVAYKADHPYALGKTVLRSVTVCFFRVKTGNFSVLWTTAQQKVSALLPTLRKNVRYCWQQR
jgi:hypothetical protein